MTSAARSVFVFGVYLMIAGAMILGAPDLFLRLIGLPPATDAWFRVLGVAVMSLALINMGCARAEVTGYFRVSVISRFFAAIAFTILVVMKLAPTQLLIFAVVDAAAAAWTKLALARPGAVAPAG